MSLSPPPVVGPEGELALSRFSVESTAETLGRLSEDRLRALTDPEYAHDKLFDVIAAGMIEFPIKADRTEGELVAGYLYDPLIVDCRRRLVEALQQVRRLRHQPPRFVLRRRLVAGGGGRRRSRRIPRRCQGSSRASPARPERPRRRDLARRGRR